MASLLTVVALCSDKPIYPTIASLRKLFSLPYVWYISNESARGKMEEE
jgi:hypothetical protein